MLDELTPRTRTGSTNDFVFDFDKVAELPTQVAPPSTPLLVFPPALPALACSTCAHLLVAHFKPVRPSALLCSALPQVVTILGAGVEHSILH